MVPILFLVSIKLSVRLKRHYPHRTKAFCTHLQNNEAQNALVLWGLGYPNFHLTYLNIEGSYNLLRIR